MNCLSDVCLFYAGPWAAAFCVLYGLLLAYGGALIVMVFALFARAARGRGLSVVDVDAVGGASVDGVGAPGVSVVIPFRNEEGNLSALLESLDGQVYGGMIEVVAVNDGSTDGGVEVIRRFRPRNKNLSIRCVNIVEPRNSADVGVGVGVGIDTDKDSGADRYSDTDTGVVVSEYVDTGAGAGLTSKQRALDIGVGCASHGLLLFTDADMVLLPTWVESMVGSQRSTGAGLVFGHTAVVVGGGQRVERGGLIRRLFELLEAYQLEYLFSFAYAFSKLGLMGSCMGNNIMVTKDVYAACGGQRGVGYSVVEDRALLGLVRGKGFKASAQEPFVVTALTYPVGSGRRFVNQVLRWARGGLRPGGGLFAAGLLLLAQNVVFLLSAVVALPPVLILLSAVNFVITWVFLSIFIHRGGSSVSKILFPAYYIFMMAETVLFLPLLLFGCRIDWKDRKV